MFGVEIDVVDDDVGAGDTLPLVPGVARSVQALGGARVDDFAMMGILHQHAGSPRRGRYALDLVEGLAAVLALVDTGAGAGVDDAGLFGIDDDREDIGIVDDALLDVVPVASVIIGLPGEMPCSGVDDLGLARVDGQRFDFVNLFGQGIVGGRADLVPGYP